MPVRPNIDNVRINLMRKNEVYVDGYPIPLVQTFTDELVQNQETYDVFGFEQQLSYTIIDGATLTMEGINDTSMQVLYDLATGQNPYPATSSTRGYYPSETLRLNVLRNVLNTDSDGYEMVQFWDNWAGLIKNPAGGPRERGVVSLAGRCKTPVMVYAPVNTKIIGVFDIVALSDAGTGTASTADVNINCNSSATGTADSGGALVDYDGGIVAIPAAKNYRNFTSYALAVEVQCCDGTGTGTLRGNVNASYRLPVTETMLISNGLLTITSNDISPFGLTLNQDGTATGNKTIVTHAFVTYIVQPATYLAINHRAANLDGLQSGRCLLGDPMAWRARYENA